MKTILCYGDSNTWGVIPLSGGRYDHKIRWPMAMARILNKDSDPEDPAWWVIEEGLNGRTSCREDPVEGGKNGLLQLLPILESHRPLDAVAVMLGTNDLKPRYSPTPWDIARGAQRVAIAVQQSKTGPDGTAPRVIMICPPPTFVTPAFKHKFGDCTGLSKEIEPYFRQLADECGAIYLNSGEIIKSGADGIHFSPESHLALAGAVAGIVKTL